jgi:hypothetical protein
VARPVDSIDAADRIIVGRSLISGGGSSIASLAGLIGLGVAAPIAAVIGIAISALGGFTQFAKLRRTQEQQEANRILTESLSQFARDCSTAITDATQALRAESERAIGEMLRVRLQNVQNEVTKLLEPARSVENAQAERKRVEALKHDVEDRWRRCQSIYAELETQGSSRSRLIGRNPDGRVSD